MKRNIVAVAEALTKVMYGILESNNAIYVEGYEGLNSGYIEQFEKYLQTTPRFPTKLAKTGDTMKDLQKIFLKIMPNATKHSFEYKEADFFTNPPTRMKAIKVKSRLTDMFLFVLISLYLLAFYLYLTVPFTHILAGGREDSEQGQRYVLHEGERKGEGERERERERKGELDVIPPLTHSLSFLSLPLHSRVP